jgi:class 3 adenylate cyclase
MPLDLSLAELARHIDETPERLREWRERGLIGTPARPDRFTHIDVERARLVQLCLRRGAGLDAIARALREGPIHAQLERYLDTLFPGDGRPATSLEEAAAEVGLDVDLARRVVAAALHGREADAPHLSAEDVQALRAATMAIQAGFSADALVEVLRVLGDALARAAEAAVRLFHFHVHQPLEASGAPDAEIAAISTAASERLNPLLEPAILYFHRKGMARAMADDIVLHVLAESGLAREADVPGQMVAAAAFVDLAGFTPLSAAMGDVKAAEVLERFGAIVHSAAEHWHGRVVKQIGDGFMLFLGDPRSAVACLLEIEERATAESHFPAVRSGVHWGPMLYRDGDYVGTTVNVAARVADIASRHEVLLTEIVWRAATPLDGVEFVRLGRRDLKGLPEEHELFAAQRRQASPLAKSIDPVCGMELAAGEAAARLAIEGSERLFCSDGCLRQFVAAPERYGARGTAKL